MSSLIEEFDIESYDPEISSESVSVRSVLESSISSMIIFSLLGLNYANIFSLSLRIFERPRLVEELAASWTDAW